ncbi:hypothetical protein RUM43_004009 [Polyplax serrata]|uniref:Uncharacterized protein n=1 Tax=Polyplax serrata TaxID=468196 RepID=A0AAN8XP69_POLSC
MLVRAGHLNSGSLNLNPINRTVHPIRQKRDAQQDIAALEAQINEIKNELQGIRNNIASYETEKGIQSKNLEEAKAKNDSTEITKFTDSLKQAEDSLQKEKDKETKKADELKKLEDELAGKKNSSGKPTEQPATPDGQSDQTAPGSGSSQSPTKATPPLQSTITSLWNFILQKKMSILSQIFDGIKNLAAAVGNKFRADVQFLREMAPQKAT